MKIKYLVSAFIFLFAIYNLQSQTYTLHPNVHPSYTLEQKIENDSLILGNKVKIYKVSFYNRENKETTIYSTTTKTVSIALHNLTTSYYTIMAYDIEGNIIVLAMDVINSALEKNTSELVAKRNTSRTIDNTSFTTTKDNSKKINNSGIAENNIIKENKRGSNKSDFIFNKKLKEDIPYPYAPDASYFVIKEVKKHSGSNISTFFYHNSKYVNTAIKKNKLDIKSFAGKNNKLTIYEIYDLRTFSKMKARLLEYYKSSSKDFSLN